MNTDEMLWDNEIKNAKCFTYDFDKMPWERFETDEKKILILYDFKHFCYELGVNIKIGKENANLKKLHGHKAYFVIEPTHDTKITYGDIFVQSDRQMAKFLDNMIKLNNWDNTDYKELLCSHNFLSVIDQRLNARPNEYDIRYDEMDEVNYYALECC